MSIEKEKSAPSLSEQFDDRETFELAGGDVEVVDVIPEKLKTEVPTLMAPGWVANPEVLKENILSLAEKGRRVISVDAPHGVDVEAGVEGTPDMPMAELRRVAAIIEALEEKGVDKVDAVGHSEGGLYTVIAATLYPEKFRSLTLVNPAGIIGPDNLRRLGVEFSLDIVVQTIRAMRNKHHRGHMKKAAREANKILASDPLKSFKEVLAISNADTREMLAALKKQGMPISIIHSVDDKAFPGKRIQGEAEVQEIDGKERVVTTTPGTITREHIDGFYATKGTHNALYLEPEKYSKLIDYALDAHEKRAKKRAGN